MDAPVIAQINLADIKFDETIYPRAAHNPTKVQEYAEHMEAIETQQNYIAVDSQNRLLDGRHRHLAYLKRADGDNPVITVYRYAPDIDSRLVAIRLNSSHGQQLTQDDKRRNCVALYSAGYKLETITRELSVSHGFAQSATKTVREAQKEERQRKVSDLWLACYTQEEIANLLDMKQPTVHRDIDTFIQIVTNDNLNKSISLHQNADFVPPLYNVWTFAKKTNNVSHFGNSEQAIVDNLLYLYTQPFDIVVDPFAGGGATIDVCRKRLRRYWVSDRKPIVERENEIRKHDLVLDGVPSLSWSDVALTYLDPPYWKQAEGQYSNDPTDLANMELDQFTDTLTGIVKDIAKRQSKGVIALLIQPTQWKTPGREFADHVTDLVRNVGNKKLTLENRVSVPYSTEQYNAQQVNWAKENRKLLVITRELIIWRVGE